MKLLKKLRDWKVWVFTIFPIAMIVAWFAITITILASGKYTTALVLTAQALLPVAVLLMFGFQIFTRIREKSYLRSAIAIVLILLFSGLQITAFIKLPDLIEKEQEKQRLYQILEETPREDPDYWERHEEWNDAYNKAYDASSTLQWINLGSYAAIAFVPISVGKRNHEEDKDEKQESQE
ncbi:MAG: hypothetical protein ACI4VK_02570 [Candidatus Coproplasma sp.]